MPMPTPSLTQPLSLPTGWVNEEYQEKEETPLPDRVLHPDTADGAADTTDTPRTVLYPEFEAYRVQHSDSAGVEGNSPSDTVLYTADSIVEVSTSKPTQLLESQDIDTPSEGVLTPLDSNRENTPTPPPAIPPSSPTMLPDSMKEVPAKGGKNSVITIRVSDKERFLKGMLAVGISSQADFTTHLLDVFEAPPQASATPSSIDQLALDFNRQKQAYQLAKEQEIERLKERLEERELEVSALQEKLATAQSHFVRVLEEDGETPLHDELEFQPTAHSPQPQAILTTTPLAPSPPPEDEDDEPNWQAMYLAMKGDFEVAESTLAKLKERLEQYRNGYKEAKRLLEQSQHENTLAVEIAIENVMAKIDPVLSEFCKMASDKTFISEAGWKKLWKDLMTEHNT